MADEECQSFWLLRPTLTIILTTKRLLSILLLWALTPLPALTLLLRIAIAIRQELALNRELLVLSLDCWRHRSHWRWWIRLILKIALAFICFLLPLIFEAFNLAIQLESKMFGYFLLYLYTFYIFNLNFLNSLFLFHLHSWVSLQLWRIIPIVVPIYHYKFELVYRLSLFSSRMIENNCLFSIQTVIVSIKWRK